MLGKIFGILTIVSFIFAIVSGNTAQLGAAVLEGASDALKLTLALTGMMCLWCGLMKVLEEAGVMRRLARLMSPLIRIFFPGVYKSGIGNEEICANISANLLGMGNAATPLALCAMEKLNRDNPEPGKATDDMVTLAVLNTSSLSIMPATIITLRSAAGSSDPFCVVAPILISSFVCSLLALTLTRAVSAVNSGICKKKKAKDMSDINTKAKYYSKKEAGV